MIDNALSKKEGDYISLLIWMPFAKDANNQGLAPCNISGSYTPVTSGKLGNAHNTQFPIQITSDTLRNKSDFTVSFWIYNSGNYINKLDFVRAVIINTKNDKLNTSGTIRFECCYDTNPRAVSVHNNSACDYFTSSITIVNEKDEWHHVAFVADGSYCKAYCDGVLIGSMQKQSGTPALTGLITIGSSNYVGAINDFRIYDNPLSQKEIKHISQGLVCHLPLSSHYETACKNKYDGAIANGLLNGSDYTKAQLTGERGYNYNLSFTGTGNGKWFPIYASNFPFTAGKTYVYSCKVRCHSKNGVEFFFRASRSDNDWVTKNVNVANTDGKWHEYSIMQTINETYDRSGTVVTCSPRVEFYTNNLNTEGVNYSLNLDIKDIQVVEADHYVPFIYNDFLSNIVSDVSGFGNHGTISDGTAPSWSDDSPRYSGCCEFDGINNYITVNSKINSIIKGGNSSMSFSFWLKIADTGRNIIFGDYSASGNINFNIEYDSNGLRWYWNGAPDKHFSIKATLNTWVHICLVYTGTEIRAYKDGILSEAYTVTLATKTKSSGNFFIGKDSRTGETMLNGYLSDFRIYATALSDADVKSIYGVSASITNTGALLLTGEVIEG